MRKLGLTLLVIIVLLVAAALIVPRFIDVNQYHVKIQNELEKRLGRQVSLGEMNLRLLPPSFQVASVEIGEDKTFTTGRPFAQAEKLAVSVKLWPLLRKEVEVNSLELVHPHIELVRNAQGVWNFATLGQQPKSEPATKAAPAQQPAQQAPAQGSSAGQLTLANLDITDGQVAITDLQKHQSRAVYDHIDLSVRDFAPDQQFSLNVAAHLPGQGKQTVGLAGRGGPIQQADLMNTPFDGELKLDQVSLSGAQKFLNSQALNGIDAQVSGQAKVKAVGSKIASNGTIRLDDPLIHGTKVGYPITLDYDVADDLSSDVIQINKGNLKLGSTPITIAGTVNSKPNPAQIDLKLTAANASIAEAARLASAFGVAFGQGMEVNGQVNMNIQARGSASQPEMNGQLSASNLSISGKDLPQPVKVNSIDLALTPDTIRSNDFTASEGSTNVTANFALAHYTTANSTITASLKAPGARIGELLNIGQAAGIAVLNGMSGDGTLTLDVRVQGPTKNPSALAFSGTGKIQNASLKMPSLTKPIQVRNTDLNFSQNAASLQNIALTLGQTNASGTVTLKNFAAPQVQFALKADKVDVAELQQTFGAAPAPQKRASVQHDFWQIIPRAEAQSAAGKGNQPSLLTTMTGGGTVEIGTIQYNDLLLTNARTNVTLDHGLIKMNPLTADLYNGKETGSVQIDMRPAQPVYAVNLKTDQVDANKLISSVSDLKQTLYGMLTSNVNATFSAPSADAIARGLNGTLNLNLTNGKLMNLDLLHELASVGKFLGSVVPSAPKGFTNIAQLSGTFDVKNGVAQTNDLKAAIDGGTMAATGLINLADQSLNLHVTAVLNKSLSQQVGGNQIGGFMNTALANNQGELVLPVIVTGTFQHPMVTPDLQQVAQMKLKNLLPTSKNPGQFTSGIINRFLGGGNQNQPDSGSGKQQGGLGGILGTLGGQQQPAQPQPSQPASAPGAPASGANQNQQQPAAQSPLGNILNQVMGKKTPQPSPSPQQQNPPK
ncbi:MAG TPA: AsmA family protein [Candidatus Angelobacter sp.]|nr:AsmA family protein [Candidatus Angelobacter sp.]